MVTEITYVDDACLWGLTVEKIFIDIMVDEVNKGNRASGQFGSKTWANFFEELQSKSKKKYLIKQMKQNFNRFHNKYREFAELLKQSGFGWDRETNTVVASEEIWQSYLRAHPKATQYCNKVCDHFLLLELILASQLPPVSSIVLLLQVQPTLMMKGKWRMNLIAQTHMILMRMIVLVALGLLMMFLNVQQKIQQPQVQSEELRDKDHKNE